MMTIMRLSPAQNSLLAELREHGPMPRFYTVAQETKTLTSLERIGLVRLSLGAQLGMDGTKAQDLFWHIP